MLRHSSLDDIEYSKYSSSTRKSIQNRQRRRHHHSKTKRRRNSTKHKKYYSIDKCAVCLDDEHLSDTKLFPCGHSFHGQCLIQWVTMTKGRKFNCPLCRQDIAHFIQMTGNQALNNQLIQIWNEHYIYNSPSLSPQPQDKGDKPIEIDLASKSPVCETSECTKKQCIQTITEEVTVTLSTKKEDGISTTKDIGQELSISSNVEQVEHPQDNVKVITHSVSHDVEQSDNRSIWKFIWKSPLSFLHQIGQKNDSKSCMVNSLLSPMYDTNVSYDDVDVDADQSSYSYSYSHSNHYYPEPITNYYNQRKYEETKHEPGHEPLSNTTHEAVIPITNNNDNNPSPNLLNFSILNIKSGILAGLCAGSSTFLMAQQIRHELIKHGAKGVMNGSIRNSFIPIMSETVPSVAVFFTSYEHLKRYLFDIDNVNNPNSLTFSQRFISAGIASSIAYYLPHKMSSVANKSITMASSKGLLPFRFATFFGTFELSKDIMNKKHDQLNLFQVASSAAIGGTISHGLYYPLTQSISNNIFALNVIPPIGNGIGNSLSINGPATAKVLYRGWVSSLYKFLPSCVVCSCAFEYSKRYFSQ